MNTILLTSLYISLFCAGLRIISSKNMILYFLRWPYDRARGRVSVREAVIGTRERIVKEKENEIERIKHEEGEVTLEVYEINSTIDSINIQLEKDKSFVVKMKILIYLMKPIIGCGACMASLYTLLYFWNFDLVMDDKMILVMFISAAFNAIIIGTYELIVAAIKYFSNGN